MHSYSSMDGRGGYLDNIFIERLWRSYKYEHVYLYAHATPMELEVGTADWFDRYNNRRPHQALGYATPHQIYTGEVALKRASSASSAVVPSPCGIA